MIHAPALSPHRCHLLLWGLQPSTARRRTPRRIHCAHAYGTRIQAPDPGSRHRDHDSPAGGLCPAAFAPDHRPVSELEEAGSPLSRLTRMMIRISRLLYSQPAPLYAVPVMYTSANGVRDVMGCWQPDQNPRASRSGWDILMGSGIGYGSTFRLGVWCSGGSACPRYWTLHGNAVPLWFSCQGDHPV